MPVTPEIVTVMPAPVATAPFVAGLVAIVELTAIALSPVTDTPLTWMLAVNVPPAQMHVADRIVADAHCDARSAMNVPATTVVLLSQSIVIC